MTKTSSYLSKTFKKHFPPFDLKRLLDTVFKPMKGEKICILIDLEDPREVMQFKFLKNTKLPVQKKAYDIFYKPLTDGIARQLGLEGCDFFAYKTTGGSNLELPAEAYDPNGKKVSFIEDIYSVYDIIICITSYSATAPLTAASKQYSFRGATMHGMNDIILRTGLAVDYNEVAREAERMRLGMTGADSVEINFEALHHHYHLYIDLARQEAQKSQGLCRHAPDVANLPAGEVYFVPVNAKGSFPVKFDDGTLAVMHVDNCRIQSINLLQGNRKLVEEWQQKFQNDPATGILGELGFGTQELPFAESDIQDEKIFGTFHLATGRNDHLNGKVTLDQFKKGKNATHEDILFSPHKTPEIEIKQVIMQRDGRKEILLENNEPAEYLWSLRRENHG